jgi:hypothetical protein
VDQEPEVLTAGDPLGSPVALGLVAAVVVCGLGDCDGVDGGSAGGVVDGGVVLGGVLGLGEVDLDGDGLGDLDFDGLGLGLGDFDGEGVGVGVGVGVGLVCGGAATAPTTRAALKKWLHQTGAILTFSPVVGASTMSAVPLALLP